MGEKLDLFMGEGKEPNCENDKWTSGENNVSPIREIIDVNFVPFIGVAGCFVLAFLLQGGVAVKWQRISIVRSKFPALWVQKMLASKFLAWNSCFEVIKVAKISRFGEFARINIKQAWWQPTVADQHHKSDASHLQTSLSSWEMLLEAWDRLFSMEIRESCDEKVRAIKSVSMKPDATSAGKADPQPWLVYRWVEKVSRFP